jgi:RPA family protein
MSESEQSGAGRREVAYRLFAAEYEDADLSYSEGDEERAPNYVITPSGARVNRLFVVGVLTEVEQVSDDILRARVVDPTGAFVLYAGQYQPDEQAFLKRTSTPTFVAVTGKARTFTPDDTDTIYTSVRPESINEVEERTRDRWTIQAAEHTLERVGQMTTALTADDAGDSLRSSLSNQGVDDGLARGIALALEHYGTTPTYLNAVRGMAIEAVRVVAGETGEVDGVDVSPNAEGKMTAPDLQAGGLDSSVLSEDAGSAESETGSDPVTAETDQDVSTLQDSADPSPEETERTTTQPTAEKRTESSETGSKGETPEAGRSGSQAPGDERSGTEVSGIGASESNAGGDSTIATGGAGAETSLGADDQEDLKGDGDELGDFEPDEEFELEEETRQEIEEEYGTEFRSGTEVEEPGDADIETPGVDAEPTPASSGGEDGAATTEEAGGTEPEDREEVAADEGATDISEERDTKTAKESDPLTSPDDVEATVVTVMQELNDGSGVPRESLHAEIQDRYDVATEAVDDAIQAALMNGQCWEPDDKTLMPI